MKENLILLSQRLIDEILVFKIQNLSISHLSSSLTRLFKLMRFRQTCFYLLHYQSNLQILEISDWDAAIQSNQIVNHSTLNFAKVQLKKAPDISIS